MFPSLSKNHIQVLQASKPVLCTGHCHMNSGLYTTLMLCSSSQWPHLTFCSKTTQLTDSINDVLLFMRIVPVPAPSTLGHHIP